MAQQTFNDTKINVEFEPTSNRQQLASGDALPTLFGKISKTMGDLKPVTFSGDYNDLENRIKEIELTQAEYDTLGDEKLSDDVIYFIKDGSTVGWSGAIILTEADYLANREEYDASNDIYFISDGGDGPFAKDMYYDNSKSELESNNVQDAIDKLDDNVDGCIELLHDHENSIEAVDDKVDSLASIVATVDDTATKAQSTANTAKNTASAALPKSGGTMTGALHFSGSAWNRVGDDAQFGDLNAAGCIGIQSLISGYGGGIALKGYASNSNYCRVMPDANGNDLYFCTNGTAYVSNGSNLGRAAIHASDFVKSSSRRLKKNIEDMTEEEAKKLLFLNPVTYNYINEENRTNRRGLIAEDTVRIIPSCVVGNVDCEDDDEHALQSIGIDYSSLVPYLIKMVQIQQKEIETLKFTLEELMS